jgi:hypothetical protein
MKKRIGKDISEFYPFVLDKFFILTSKKNWMIIFLTGTIMGVGNPGGFYLCLFP